MTRWATRVLGHSGVQFAVVLVLGLALLFGGALAVTR